MHECMPRHLSAGSWLHPRKKCRKIQEKLHILYACRHAKAFLSWKPVAPEVKNAFMHAGDSLPVRLCEVLQSLPE